MDWLFRAFTQGWQVLRAAPTFAVPVLLIFLFNNYSSEVFSFAEELKRNFIASGISGAVPALVNLITARVIILFLALTATAAAISVYSVHVAFVSFATGHAYLLRTLLRLDWKDVILYFICHLIITACFAALGVALLFVGVDIIRAPEWLRLPIAVVVFVLMYPLYYMALSYGAVISCSGGTWLTRIKRLSYACVPQNFARLVVYYLTRIGAELCLVGAIGWLAFRLGAPSQVAPILIGIAVLLPLALLRTAGFALKLEILRNDRWFSSMFQRYYAQGSEVRPFSQGVI